MADPGAVPASIDVTTPNVARIYDYYLGGKDNYAADRAAAEQVLATMPEGPMVARLNRGFLKRAVEHLARDAGISQFVDVGSGLPTLENVHEVAQRVNPDARVVYVDYDAVAIAHARTILSDVDNTTAIQGDLRRPAEIFDHPELRARIDFTQPFAVLLIAVLHFVHDDEDPYGTMATLRDALPPGSYLALTHVCVEEQPDRQEDVSEAVRVYRRATAQLNARTRPQIARMFDGLELLEPGLASLTEWRPEAPPSEAERRAGSWLLAGVGRKP